MQAAFTGRTHRYPYKPTPDQQLRLLLEVRSEPVELLRLMPNVPLNQRSTCPQRDCSRLADSGTPTIVFFSPAPTRGRASAVVLNPDLGLRQDVISVCGSNSRARFALVGEGRSLAVRGRELRVELGVIRLQRECRYRLIQDYLWLSREAALLILKFVFDRVEGALQFHV
jgi:hypothetical protein